VTRAPITKLPKTLENVAESLTVLKLTGTRLACVNDVVFTLRRLQQLAITDCKIRTVPDKFGCLPALQLLDLSRNRLTDVPVSIIRHRNLASLVLDGNQIETLSSLPSNSFLVQVHLDGNPIGRLPPSYNTGCVWPAAMRELILHGGPANQPCVDEPDEDEVR
jgi:Leucine-rich repeat (LRR) protein